MPKKEFSAELVPRFDGAPAVIALAGEVSFFVEEAAAEARSRLLDGVEGIEHLRFDEDAPSGAVEEALLNRSLFAPRRLVEIDVSRLLGSDSPGELAERAVEAWERGTPAGRREAFRHARRLVAALKVSAWSDPVEAAAAVTRRVRKDDLAEPLAAIFREMPPERDACGATLPATIASLAERPNDGVVALVIAVDPPGDSDFLSGVARRGLLLTVRLDPQDRRQIESALRRLAQARARERGVSIEPDAIARLLTRTDAVPGTFATELEKLFDWAGEEGRIRVNDVGEQVADEASEDYYRFLDHLARREAPEALQRLERMFSGRDVRAGRRVFDPDDGWPQIFLGMLTGEIRKMLLIRARLDEPGAPPFDPSIRFDAYKARVAPWLDEPVPPFGRSGLAGAEAFPTYRAAVGAASYSATELARALARAADVDVVLKNSAPVLETFTAYVGELIGA